MALSHNNIVSIIDGPSSGVQTIVFNIDQNNNPENQNGMLTNNIVCNYAVGGNMMGASIYTQVTISFEPFSIN